MKSIKNISGRNKVVDAKASNVEHDIVNAPDLFHPGPAKLARHFPKLEYGGYGPAPMSDEDAVHVPVVSDAASDGGFPVDGVAFGLDPGQVRVLQVHKHSALLAEVSVQHVPYHFRRPLVPLHHCLPLCRYFQHEALVFPDPLFPQALGFLEQPRCALWV